MILPSLKKIQDEIIILNKQKEMDENSILTLSKTLHDLKSTLLDRGKILYNLHIRETHILEIFRLASIHFPRLQEQSELSPKDIQELEKWINKAKDNDGLICIIEAMEELRKYYPRDIKSNLYGLVQKIIMEGAYKKKKK